MCSGLGILVLPVNGNLWSKAKHIHPVFWNKNSSMAVLILKMFYQQIPEKQMGKSTSVRNTTRRLQTSLVFPSQQK